MKSPIRGETRIQMMSEEQLRSRLKVLNSIPRNRITNSEEEERRELLLELERHSLVRTMRKRVEKSIDLHNSRAEADAREAVRRAEAAEERLRGAQRPLVLAGRTLTPEERAELAQWVAEVMGGKDA